MIVDLVLRKLCRCDTKTFLKESKSLELIILENILRRIEIIRIGR